MSDPYDNTNIEKNQGLMARNDESIFKPRPEIPKPNLDPIRLEFENIENRIREEIKNQCIIEDWVFDLSWKMQTIILEMLRGPDTHQAPTVKIMARWCRKLMIKNADENTSFMKKGIDEKLSLEEISDELEYCTGHYIAHLIQMLACITYFHPEEKFRAIAKSYYVHIVEHDLHLNIETEDQIERRLRDKK